MSKAKVLRPDLRVLDIGCGCGVMATELAAILGPGSRYIGFDVHEPSIEWCKAEFSGKSNFLFHLAPVESPYSAIGGGKALEEYAFPTGDGTIDLVIGKSIFTHLLEEETFHYLDETRRVLSEDGQGILTFFVYTRESQAVEHSFPYNKVGDPEGESLIRWRRDENPRAAVAYSRTLLEDLIGKAGLRIENFVCGFYPGQVSITGQDQVIVRRR